MSIWKNRPLFVGASLWMLCALLSFFLPTVWKIRVLMTMGCLLLLTLTVCVVLRCRRGRWQGGVALLSLFCMVGAMLSSYVTFDIPTACVDDYVGEVSQVQGRVSERRSFSEGFSVYILDVKTIDQQDLNCRAYLTCYDAVDMDVGDDILLEAEVVDVETLSDGIYQPYQLLGDGIMMGLVAETGDSINVLSAGEGSFLYRMASSRKALSAHLRVTLGKDTAGMLSALLLGERADLAYDTVRDFSRCGVSHLLAISGLHMTILFGSLALLLKAFGFSPKIRAVVLAVLSLSYLCYLGFPPSATRAVVMLGMTYLSTLLHRHADPLTSLGLAGMGILAFSPTSVADVGFWLSFASTLGLITLLPCGENAGGVFKRQIIKLAKGLLAGVVAISMSLCIVAVIFGKTSLFSAPMTLLLTPVVGVLLFLTPLYVVLSLWFPPDFLGRVLDALVDLLEMTCEFVSRLPYGMISLDEPWILGVAVGMLVLTLLLLGINLPRRLKGVTLTPILVGWLTILVGLGVVAHAPGDTIEVSYMTPSTVTEMIVYTQGQEAVVCDFSNGSGKSMRAARLQVSESGATEISAMIITHYHKALAGNLSWLMESEMVRTLYLPQPQNADEQYMMQACIEKAEVAKTEVRVYDFGEPLVLFDHHMMCVKRTMIDRSVQPVLIMTFASSTQQMTYVGGGALESDLSAYGQDCIIQSQFVIFGHHGPKTKQRLDCTLSSDAKMVMVADETVQAYLPEWGMSWQGDVWVGNSTFEMKEDTSDE